MEKKKADIRRTTKMRKAARNAKINEIKKFIREVAPRDFGKVIIKGHQVYEVRKIGTIKALYDETVDYFYRKQIEERFSPADIEMAHQWAEMRRGRFGLLEIIDIDEDDVWYQSYDQQGRSRLQMPIPWERIINDVGNGDL